MVDASRLVEMASLFQISNFAMTAIISIMTDATVIANIRVRMNALCAIKASAASAKRLDGLSTGTKGANLYVGTVCL